MLRWLPVQSHVCYSNLQSEAMVVNSHKTYDPDNILFA